MDFGDKLKSLRTAMGFSQEQLADMLHLTRAAICNYENNKRRPNDDIQDRLATIFNISLDELWDRSSLKKTYGGNGASEGSSISHYALRLTTNPHSFQNASKGPHVIYPEDEPMRNGDIVLVELNNEMIYSRYFDYPEFNFAVLQPEDPAFPELLFRNEKREELRILGKAVFSQKETD